MTQGQCAQRFLRLSLTEDRFEPKELAEDAFAHSLGVHQGPAERVEIVFDSSMSRYVRDRIWHSSQTIEERPDGGLILKLTVSNDWALRGWILSFGALAKVIAPVELAVHIRNESERTAALYMRTPDAAAGDQSGPAGTGQ